MKPVYLEFSGFNSFSEKAVINFKSLLSGGIFGIFGDTGAGKSTILDVIGFALYGKVNRIGKEGSSIVDIINFSTSKAEVAFEFEVEYGGERGVYRIERSLSRNRGVQKAVLYIQKNQAFTAVCQSPSQVNKQIEEQIIGICFDDFKKCIALPQGEFSKFLTSSRKERLQLISKLFSLEEYGYALYKKVNDRLGQKNIAYEGIKGQLKSYEGVSEVALEELLLKERQTNQCLQAAADALSSVQARLLVLDELLKSKRQLQSVQEKLSQLQPLQPLMEENRAALEKLQPAKQSCDLAKDREDTFKKLQISRNKHLGLCQQEERVIASLSLKKEQISQLNFDERIQTQQERLLRVERAQQDMLALNETEKHLSEAREKYRRHNAELKKYLRFDYEGEKARLQAELALLPQEDNLLDFVNNHFKAALLAQEYLDFCRQLKDLMQKYPQVATDVQAILSRYAAKSQSAAVDIYAQAEKFRAASKRKAEIGEQLIRLESVKEKYADAVKRETELRQEGERLQAEYVNRKAELFEIINLGSPEKIKEEITRLKKQRDELLKDCETLQAQTVSLQREISAKEAEQAAYLATLEKNDKTQKALFVAAGVTCLQEAEDLLARYGEPETVKKRTEEYFLQLYSLRAEENRLADICANAEGAEEEFTQNQTRAALLNQEVSEYTRILAVNNSESTRMQKQLQEKCALEKSSLAQLQEIGLLEQLKELIKADKFMEFIAVEYLQDMAADANNLLLTLTGGRYYLIYDKNFAVGDNFNGGAIRGVHTLSGGETFLVSLALALALSAAIHQKSLRPIEFFFLDEGFGTLDEELVETVMDSLEKLKNENFAIGVISHIGELKNRLENRITVLKADGDRGSRIQS